MLPSDAMNQSSPTVLPVVLAAGLGTRMKSSKPKVLHELCGRPMLAYVLDAAEEVGGRRPLVVYSPATSAIVEVFADRADFALQETPLGTADAVKAALAVAPEDVAEVLILSGDVPLVDADVLAELVDLRRARGAVMAIVSVRTVHPQGLGRVIRSEDGGQVLRIVEEKDGAPEELEIDEINAGLYAFEARLASPPDRRRQAVGRYWRVLPAGAGRAGARGQGRGDLARGRGRRYAGRHQRPRPAGHGRIRAAHGDQRSPSDVRA